MHPLSSEPSKDFHWPNGFQAAAWLSWHVDVETGLLASGTKIDSALVSASEARYGLTTALPRILDLCREYDVKASFAFPAYVAEKSPDALLSCIDRGHEIILHGYIHENVQNISAAEEEDILLRSISVFERLIGTRPLGWTAPSWGMNTGTINLLHRHGLLYDNSLMEHDTPTVFDFADGPLFELPISTILEDWQQFGIDLATGGSRMASIKNAFSLWIDELEGLVEYGGLFSPTFHPNLVGRPGALRELDKLLAKYRESSHIWWTNGAEIAKHCLNLHSESKIGKELS